MATPHSFIRSAQVCTRAYCNVWAVIFQTLTDQTVWRQAACSARVPRSPGLECPDNHRCDRCRLPGARQPGQPLKRFRFTPNLGVDLDADSLFMHSIDSFTHIVSSKAENLVELLLRKRQMLSSEANSRAGEVTTKVTTAWRALLLIYHAVIHLLRNSFTTARVV